MMCCNNSARILKDDKWSCSECGSILDNKDQEQLDFFGYHPEAFKPYKENKCDCGSDKTFGTNSYTHAFWCSTNKK